MFRKSVWIDLVEPVVCLRGQPKDKQTINILRGVIRLQLSHSAIVHGMTIQFTGISKTLWPEGNYLKNKKRHKKNSQHWDKHILVDSVIPILSCKNPLLLKKGTHAFPFEILLSNALSESIECGLGHIRYKLFCQVHVKPFYFIKSILKTQKNVVLVRLPLFIEQQQQNITQTHLINDLGGQLLLNIEKGCIIPGTLLPMTFHFNQECQLHAIDQITVKLIERQKYKAPSKQTTRILHHESILLPNHKTTTNNEEIQMVYVVPDKHKLKVHPSTCHPNIKVKHWIQVYLKLLLKDGTTKDLQLEASITVLLSSMDDYLTLPLYSSDNSTVDNTATLPVVKKSNSGSCWLKNKIYGNNRIIDYKPNNNLMLFMTASPPPLYEDI